MHSTGFHKMGKKIPMRRNPQGAPIEFVYIFQMVEKYS